MKSDHWASGFEKNFRRALNRNAREGNPKRKGRHCPVGKEAKKKPFATPVAERGHGKEVADHDDGEEGHPELSRKKRWFSKKKGGKKRCA